MREKHSSSTQAFLEILDKIRQEQPHFSSAQRQVGSYVLENYQNDDGSVTVPEALRRYMGCDVIRPAE